VAKSRSAGSEAEVAMVLTWHDTTAARKKQKSVPMHDVLYIFIFVAYVELLLFVYYSCKLTTVYPKLKDVRLTLLLSVFFLYSLFLY